MRRVWIVANPASGSTDDATLARVRDAVRDAGGVIVGETAFPADPLPDTAALDAAEADTVAVLAGDGTINAAACRLAGWSGALLILPGGTMNLLARLLHGDAAPDAIVAAAAAGAPRIALPIVEAAGHCAFVGLILGPAASWTRVREAVRASRWRALGRAVRLAWRRSFARGIRISGIAAPAQAVFVRAEEDALAVAAIDARDGRALAELGWSWLTGDWLAASAVRSTRLPRFTIRGRRPVAALFDGELVRLPAGTSVVAARSAPMFLSTREPA